MNLDNIFQRFYCQYYLIIYLALGAKDCISFVWQRVAHPQVASRRSVQYRNIFRVVTCLASFQFRISLVTFRTSDLGTLGWNGMVRTQKTSTYICLDVSQTVKQFLAEGYIENLSFLKYFFECKTCSHSSCHFQFPSQFFSIFKESKVFW